MKVIVGNNRADLRAMRMQNKEEEGSTHSSRMMALPHDIYHETCGGANVVGNEQFGYLSPVRSNQKRPTSEKIPNPPKIHDILGKPGLEQRPRRQTAVQNMSSRHHVFSSLAVM